jgi:SulP family sulfate permease
MLAHEARAMAEAGVTLHLTNLKAPVRRALEASGAMAAFGPGQLHVAKSDALRAIYAELDAGTCAACAARVFSECQSTLPDGRPRDPPRPEFALIRPVRAP